METIVGIDLGTTNSEIAVIDGKQPRVIEEDGQPILPSAVALDREGNVLIGEPARNQALLAPERTILSIKRKMGEERKVPLGDKLYTPQEISAMILRALKARAEGALGRPVHKAVITVPAYFKEAQREATRQAGELAGLEVVRIVHEPTAAALSYEPNPAECERVLVYDLGGGTFDVSVVQLEQQVVEVLASHGDTHLGGDDMDQLLFDHVCDAFQQEHDIDLRQDARSRSRVLRAVEEAKKRLSFEPVAQVQVEFVSERDGMPIHLDMEVDRPTYEGLIEPLIERTLTSLDQALSDAKLRAGQIDKVVLVGGATRTPRIRTVLEERLSQPVHEQVQPDLCVALGAAVQAGLIAGIDVGPVLVDVTPHTLGVGVLDLVAGIPNPYAFSPIIRRNTALPASRTEMYVPTYEGQDAAKICVFQGEHDDIRQNTPLGEVLLDHLQADAADDRIPVRFDLDLDGMLTVTATEAATGRSRQLTIDSALGRLRRTDGAAARRRVDAAMGPAESPVPEAVTDGDAQAVSPPLREALAEANTLLEKGRRLLDDLEGEDAEDLRAAITIVDGATQQGDEQRLRQALPELEDLVFYIEEV